MTQNYQLAPADTKDAVKVLSVTHWNDRLFHFEVERPSSFRFRSGEFVMIGLLNDEGKPLLRAYSIAAPFWSETLAFYSIKVQDGPLTSKLQNIAVGDYIIMKTKPVGTLVLDALIPGKRLYRSSHRHSALRLLRLLFVTLRSMSNMMR